MRKSPSELSKRFGMGFCGTSKLPSKTYIFVSENWVSARQIKCPNCQEYKSCLNEKNIGDDKIATGEYYPLTKELLLALELAFPNKDNDMADLRKFILNWVGLI